MTPRKFFVGRAIGFLVVLVVLGVGWAWYTLRPAAPRSQQESVATATYVCDSGKTITASFYKGTEPPPAAPGEPPTPTGSVALTLSDGRSMTLPQTLSASGVRYANADESFVFWNKGNSAFIVEGDATTYDGCTTQ